MQQIAVIQDGKVFATHEGGQSITFDQYPNAEKILLMKDGERVKVRDDEPALDRVTTYHTNIPSVNSEVERLQTALASTDARGIIDLDSKGEAELIHGLNSKWYMVSVTAIDAAMPNLHIQAKKDRFVVKGGANNGRVAYALTLISPPKGRGNQILTAPY